MKRKEISRKFYIQLPIIIGIIGLLIVVFLKVGENLKKERNTKIITEATLIDVVDIAELSTAEFIYNGIAEIPKKEHSNEILCRVRYKAKVKASINMEDIKFDIDDKKKKITPILPKIKITPIFDEQSGFSFIPEKVKNDIDLKEIMEICRKDVTKETRQTTALHKSAEENLRDIIQALTYPIIKSKGYKLVWK